MSEFSVGHSAGWKCYARNFCEVFRMYTYAIFWRRHPNASAKRRQNEAPIRFVWASIFADSVFSVRLHHFIFLSFFIYECAFFPPILCDSLLNITTNKTSKSMCNAKKEHTICMHDRCYFKCHASLWSIPM